MRAPTSPRSPRRQGTRITTGLTAAGVLLAVAACGGDDSSGGDEGNGEPASPITMWTPHVTPERLAGQEAVAAAFTEETGIEVEVVPLAGADQNQSLVTGAASGDVPDVILHAPDQTAAWNEQGLLDTEVPAQVMENLGAETFSEQALDLVTVGGALAAVPSDGWGHLVVYRQDLLDDAGLDTPETVQDLAEIAAELSSGSMSGMALGTQPGNPFTTESLEAILQPTGCDLITDGEVTVDSPECAEGLRVFRELADSSAGGQFDVESARAAYLAGNAAMLLFSSHIIDELAGLDPNNPLTCAECADDPMFLAENSGFVTVLNAAETGGRQYGATLNYGVPVGANADEARQYIEYVLGDGYVDTLATATEGRVPLRGGTAENPTEFIDAWGELPFGPDPENDASISEIYGEEVVQALQDGANAISRWGFGTDDATVAGAVFSQHVLAQNIEPLYRGTDPAEVAAQLAAEVSTVQQEIGG
ncbi:extracellular solute-binding protein [Phytoactinopolyspora alkaliphila]|uniref:Extracellular solute-binding protein n=1 Tax=Phytoactinopolyspora alkaliphila TaxID=1783498 RepID=A0A6N9YGM4_9ACTN|nr:extracellular solute-binding protein [Phytoactinopolyspora alkaliphila]NED94211.1 extracellular solute-binding protein [Phytoactinopolyspora alkaliphila]